MPPSGRPAPSVWVLADDRPGTRTQALAVAEALGWPFVVKRLDYSPSARLHNLLRGAGLVGLTAASRADIRPPWPDLAIAAGRRSAPVLQYLKAASGGRTFVAQIMHPDWRTRDFDLVVLPVHDGRVERPHRINVPGAPHRVRPALLAAEAAEWSAEFVGLPAPRIAVLVGGPVGGGILASLAGVVRRDTRDLMDRAAALARQSGGSLLIATSRRTTPAMRRLLEADHGVPARVWHWRAGEPGPYLGILGVADAIVVTGDSITMCSEASATGRPLHIFAGRSFGGPAHRRFHADLYRRGVARPLGERFDEGRLETWTYAPPDAGGETAAAIRARLVPRLPAAAG